jgi:hypothetical protein
VLGLSTFVVWLSLITPPKFVARLDRALASIDEERVGKAKRYFVYDVLDCKDIAQSIFAFVAVGLFFMLLVPLVAYFQPWSEIKIGYVLLMFQISLFCILLIPVSLFAYLHSLTSRVLVVVDDGFEVWKIRKDGVALRRRVLWTNIKKLAIYDTMSWAVQAIYLDTTEGNFFVRDDGANVLDLLQDLQRYIPGVISHSGSYSINRLQVIMKELRQRSGR